MAMFDGMLAEVGSRVDVSAIALHLGISADKVEEAIAALGIAHAQPGDTVDIATGSTGIPSRTIDAILQDLGGPAALASLSSLLGQREGIYSGAVSELFNN